MQFGIFNPLSRAHHEGDNAAEPWMFGPVAEKNSKAAIELKYQLFPYLYTYARQAHDTGLPIVRGLFMEYPYDGQAVQTEDQFFFREEILVAPVLKKGERVRSLYLPEGEWIDFNDKQTVYLGGQKIPYRAPLSVIPMFVRKGSIVPMMPVMQYIHERKDYPLLVHIFPNYEDESARFELYEDQGEDLGYQQQICARTSFVCTTLDKGYHTRIASCDNGFTPSDRRNIVLVYHLGEKPHEVRVDNQPARQTEEQQLTASQESDSSSLLWSWNEETRECRVKLPDRRAQTKISIH